ncbi:hypothetical protein LQU92_01510 [Kocuria sp. LUK]|uniref:hypothetical protein n=1 Tax=Kocuria sp. LUK TaxID=2897828 RepID=UPI001E3BE3E4|nr:hypothetical protein [Kocuria sp. LUK]MCD1143920.1 hypothetical protein [Kocuria sp. LUK]
MPDHDALLVFLREHLEQECGGDIHVLRSSVRRAIEELEEGTDTLYALVVEWGEDAGPGFTGPTRWKVVESETGSGPVFAAGTVTGFTGADEGQVEIAQAVQEHGFETVGAFLYGIVPGSSVAMVRRLPAAS